MGQFLRDQPFVNAVWTIFFIAMLEAFFCQMSLHITIVLFENG